MSGCESHGDRPAVLPSPCPSVTSSSSHDVAEVTYAPGATRISEQQVKSSHTGPQTPSEVLPFPHPFSTPALRLRLATAGLRADLGGEGTRRNCSRARRALPPTRDNGHSLPCHLARIKQYGRPRASCSVPSPLLPISAMTRTSPKLGWP